MIAEVIFTGTELLLGQILNTNARILQQELSNLGIDLYYQITVGDNLQRCAAAIKQAAERVDLVVIGGGLGPTEDDISREALAEALQVELEQNHTALAVVKRFFDQRGVAVSQNNLKQALAPRGSMVVDNPIGTAPGIILEFNNTTFIMVPGPPPEFIKMVREQVIPYLEEKLAGTTGLIKSKVLKFCGIGEALLDEKLSDLLKSNNPTVAPTAKYAEVHLRITAKARDIKEAEQMIAGMEERVRSRLGTYIYGVDDDTLSSVVSGLVWADSKTIAVAEDFTGGKLSYQLSSAPHADKVFIAGLVAADYKGLATGCLTGFSDDTPDYNLKARNLATALRKQFGCDIGVAITAANGPDTNVSGTSRVFFVAADINDTVMSREMILWGDREDASQRAAIVTLMLLWRYLKHGLVFK